MINSLDTVLVQICHKFSSNVAASYLVVYNRRTSEVCIVSMSVWIEVQKWIYLRKSNIYGFDVASSLWLDTTEALEILYTNSSVRNSWTRVCVCVYWMRSNTAWRTPSWCVYAMCVDGGQFGMASNARAFPKFGLPISSCGPFLDESFH